MVGVSMTLSSVTRFSKYVETNGTKVLSELRGYSEMMESHLWKSGCDIGLQRRIALKYAYYQNSSVK
jgi:hypothetical protein